MSLRSRDNWHCGYLLLLLSFLLTSHPGNPLVWEGWIGEVIFQRLFTSLCFVYAGAVSVTRRLFSPPLSALSDPSKGVNLRDFEADWNVKNSKEGKRMWGKWWKGVLWDEPALWSWASEYIGRGLQLHKARNEHWITKCENVYFLGGLSFSDYLCTFFLPNFTKHRNSLTFMQSWCLFPITTLFFKKIYLLQWL
jgi:hypothetical protein